MSDFSFFQCGRYRFEMSQARPLVMGILNVTPDSFADGGRFSHFEQAMAQAEAMLQAGVDIIDIGGESTRPGAPSVSEETELERVLPLVMALRDCGKPLSVDTSKPIVMRAVLAEGVDMINDVNALQAPNAVEVIKASHCGLCLMHKQGMPSTMQQAPHYADVVSEVTDFLAQRVEVLLQAGIAPERVTLDPGFGFGKKLAHNLALAQHLPTMTIRHLPWLIGVSRKSMLGELTGHEVAGRLLPSVVAALALWQQGAHILRVHDVAETIQGIKVWQAITGLHE